MNLKSYLEQLRFSPETISFTDTIAVIDESYIFTPCEFNNGSLINSENQNNGSCKIFAFAQIHKLPQALTLHCFGDYYRIDVLQHPHAEDHQNIRNFIRTGWQGISFRHSPLTEK